MKRWQGTASLLHRPSLLACPSTAPLTQNAQALRLGGQSLLDAALCLGATDPGEAKQLVKVGAWSGGTGGSG